MELLHLRLDELLATVLILQFWLNLLLCFQWGIKGTTKKNHCILFQKFCLKYGCMENSRPNKVCSHTNNICLLNTKQYTQANKLTLFVQRYNLLRYVTKFCHANARERYICFCLRLNLLAPLFTESGTQHNIVCILGIREREHTI